MHLLSRVWGISALTIAAMLLPLVGTAGEPVKLKFESPFPPKKKDGPESNAIQFQSGWPLTLKLVTKDKNLLGTFVLGSFNGQRGTYPEAGQPSWLIFDDADDCLWLEGQAVLGVPCADQTGEGEVFLQFNPDVDFPGLEDICPFAGPGIPILNRCHGRPDVRAQLADASRRPEWGGPVLKDILDGVGYGPNDDLPGLVLVSNVGVGVVYDPVAFVDDCDPAAGSCEVEICRGEPPQCEQVVPPAPLLESWNRAVPEARNNLSGLMGSVSYELNDHKLRTTVTSSLVVPRFMFSHLEMFDPCLGEWDEVLGLCLSGDSGNRIDAGGLNVPAADASTSIIELRAFVVNGAAPAVVEDCTGDGNVTADDAVCMGFDLISNEVVQVFEQRGQDAVGLLCNDVIDPWKGSPSSQNFRFVDFDFNLFPFGVACPGGAGGLTRPPR